jgi:hypothetical protein
MLLRRLAVLLAMALVLAMMLVASPAGAVVQDVPGQACGPGQATHAPVIEPVLCTVM